MKYLGEDDEIENCSVRLWFVFVAYYHRQPSETRSMQKEMRWKVIGHFDSVSVMLISQSKILIMNSYNIWNRCSNKNGTLSVWFNRVLGDALWWRWSWSVIKKNDIFSVIFQSEMVFFCCCLLSLKFTTCQNWKM